MSRFLRQWWLEASPVAVCGALVLVQALVVLVLLPLLQNFLGASYGMGFADDYDVLARNLARGNGYRFFADTAPTMMREPGYPLVLAALFRFFGESLTAARVANLIFAFFAAVSLCQLTRRITGNEWAVRIAPALFLLHPGIVLAEARGGVESLFIMLLLLFFSLLYRALGSRRWRDYLIAGLMLGLSATVRSTALLFPVFLIAYFILWERARPPVLTMVGRVCVLGAAAALVLTPWMVRNYRLVGGIVPTASVAGVSAYAGYYICTHLTFDNTFFQADSDAGTARASVAQEAGLRFKEMGNHYYLYFYDTRDEVTFNHLLSERVESAYLRSPLLLAGCSAKNLFHFWFSGKTWPVTLINMAIQLPYLILAAIGMVAGLRGERRQLHAPLLLFIVYTLAVYLPILAQARYSLHLAPLLSLLAAVPVAEWWRGRKTTEA